MRHLVEQTRQPDGIHIAIDNNHEGPGVTRSRGLAAATSEWVIYLDDDDYLLAPCIEKLLACADETGADVIYSWFTVINGTDPFPQFFAQPWDDLNPHIFPITYLVRTEVARAAGGFPSVEEMGNRWAAQWNGEQGGEDWFAIQALMEVGAKIVHLPERLWVWDHGNGEHFSGRTW